MKSIPKLSSNNLLICSNECFSSRLDDEEKHKDEKKIIGKEEKNGTKNSIPLLFSWSAKFFFFF